MAPVRTAATVAAKAATENVNPSGVETKRNGLKTSDADWGTKVIQAQAFF